MIIRSSKHCINDINLVKLNKIEEMFLEYKKCLDLYITDILNNNLILTKKMSSKLLPTYNIKHSKYKRDIYIKASEIIRSQIKKASKKRYKKYKYIYSYYVKNKPSSKFTKTKFKELYLKEIILTKYFTKPDIKNLTINLTNELYDIKNGKEFDEFISIKLPFMNNKGTRALKVKIPIRHHRHYNKLRKSGFNLRNNISLKFKNNKLFLNFIWGKDDVISNGVFKSIGIDMGYKKLLTTNKGDIIGQDMVKIYEKISRRVQGSKSFKKSLIERDNMINYYLNNLDISGLSHIFIEDLKDVKKGSKNKINKKFNNKLQRWSYVKCISKLERLSEVVNIKLVKVSPAYTSQTCSNCGSCNKNFRIKESFNCGDCLLNIDADINAAININNRGVYSLSN